jgi:excisionase family DNA binding protein
MHRQPQSRMRKNPASLRQHGSRFAPQSSPLQFESPSRDVHESEPTAPNVSPTSERFDPALTGISTEATGGDAREKSHLLTVKEVAELLHVPVSWVYERTRRRGSDQLPHLKLGKYVRFEEEVVAEFIRGQRRA